MRLTTYKTSGRIQHAPINPLGASQGRALWQAKQLRASRGRSRGHVCSRWSALPQQPAHCLYLFLQRCAGCCGNADEGLKWKKKGCNRSILSGLDVHTKTPKVVDIPGSTPCASLLNNERLAMMGFQPLTSNGWIPSYWHSLAGGTIPMCALCVRCPVCVALIDLSVQTSSGLCHQLSLFDPCFK